MKFFPIVLLFTALTGCTGCAHTSKSSTELGAESCIAFKPEAPVLCFAAGQMVTQGPAKELCHADNPPRWIVKTVEGEYIMIGFDCMSLVKEPPSTVE